MKLIRLVHKKEAHKLAEKPLTGCTLYRGNPFFCGFDAVSAAIIESQVYMALGEIPPSILVVEYVIPDNSLHVFNELPVYEDYAHGSHHLGAWVRGFLKDKAALVAAFPSKHWARQLNYIVNPRHELFPKVEISEIRKIYR